MEDATWPKFFDAKEDVVLPNGDVRDRKVGMEDEE